MNDISFAEMQAIQRELQEKYRDQWVPIAPENARQKLLWMLAEAGEAADIIKKQGDAAIVGNPETRRHFTEELCDVLMYLNDVMLCYGITPKELAGVYREKHRHNMARW